MTQDKEHHFNVHFSLFENYSTNFYMYIFIL